MATSPPTGRFKLVFFVPSRFLPQVKTVVFATGAGKLGNYSECCFTTPGVGQFRPGDAAKPAIGEVGQLEEVDDVRCEVHCSERSIAQAAVEAMKKAHPYEEPAYEVYKLEAM